MKKHLVLTILCMLLVSGTVWAEEVNQIVEPQFKNASVHDPSIIKVEDTYYVFGSHLAVAKSTDLMNWDIVASGVMPENPLFSDVTERKSTRLNSSHVKISYAVFCLKKKKQ